MTTRYTTRMLWAFGAECILLVAVLLLMDVFPGGVLAAALFVAVGLPIICFGSIVIQPRVYRAWLEGFRQIRAVVFGLVIGLWRCLNRENAVRFMGAITKMKACPDTADGWFAFSLFPFKAYVVITIGFLMTWHGLSTANVPSARLHYSEAPGAILDGYLIILFVLSIGALLQALFCKPARPRQTIIVVVAGCLFLMSRVLWAVA